MRVDQKRESIGGGKSPCSSRLISSVLLTVSLLAGGCGYTLGYRAPPGVTTIAVPIFHNSTFSLRREIEYELTSLVRQELQSRTSLQLVDVQSADLVLRGNIVEFREDPVVEGGRNRKIEANVSAAVEILVEDRVNGYELAARRITGIEPFSPGLGESFRDGRARALENLAKRIVVAVEYWDDYAQKQGPGPAGGQSPGEIQ